MKHHFLPPGEALEKAVMGRNVADVVRLMIEQAPRPSPELLATPQFAELPCRIAALVVWFAMTLHARAAALTFLRGENPESPIIPLLRRALGAVSVSVTEEELNLRDAVLCRNEEEMYRLIEEKQVRLRHYSEELFQIFPELSRRALVTFFHSGFHDCIQPLLLRFLLRECERPDRQGELDYRQRLMYANLMIHIFQEEITPDDRERIEEDWFPMGNSIEAECDRSVYCHPYSYYFDPRHRYLPRFADGEYETPAFVVRRKSRPGGIRVSHRK